MSLTLERERRLQSRWDLVVGVDEAGRGPLAGPVCCGAFAVTRLEALPLSQSPYSGIADSKQIAEDAREVIFDEILHIARTGRRNKENDEAKENVKTDNPPEMNKEHLESGEANKENLEMQEANKQNLETQETSKQTQETQEASDEKQPSEPVVKVNEGQSTCVAIDGCDELTEEPGQVLNRVKGEEGSETMANELNLTETHKDAPFRFAFSKSEPPEIDILNILNATLVSMTRAVYLLIAALPQEYSQLKVKILVDGNRVPPLLKGAPATQTNSISIPTAAWNEVQRKVVDMDVETIVKGDATVFSIAAASIVAKVTRDRILRKLAEKYPAFDLDTHKGYPTPAHKKLVSELGPTDIHRLSFEPCYSLLKSKMFAVPSGRDFQKIQELKEAKKLRGKRSKGPGPSDAAQPKLKLVKR
eukprot:Gregarina_sp_Pseudo_9__5086@NODE_534_length_2619_cov_129_950388_g504_i0_p1_GENE_NODE_534_length_2619_cov_129_950388_g504_i0NODE_534_length_2619_cov_129_950388_g504_i0_p1_ORF_typecomplete_len418_score69_92RNase_HII/PF01351_18/1_4e14RNase_HII/PF01351_18/1_6e26Mucin/PF01456_17/0_037Rib_5P_isom_A/PF06026_14/0_2Rib_5P_isom_A/PF06026_14/3_3e03Methyltransf_32/PF13679_6/0_85Lin8/PF03353_15/0_96EVI2A/PF05399_11/3_2KCT2/PF17818_1/10_NODE_534_length_2619_cov_129_950388_g504_i011622415